MKSLIFTHKLLTLLLSGLMIMGGMRLFLPNRVAATGSGMMMRGGGSVYVELGEALITRYHLAAQEDPAKLPVLRLMIWEAAASADLHGDLETDEDTALADFDDFLEKIHGYPHDLSDTMIADGLHILGLAPEGQRLVEFIARLIRVSGSEAPSLWEAVTRGLSAMIMTGCWPPGADPCPNTAAEPGRIL